MSALQTGGGASPPSFEGSLLPGTPLQTGATYQSYLEGGGGEGGSTYIPSTYIPNQNAELELTDVVILGPCKNIVVDVMIFQSV